MKNVVPLGDTYFFPTLAGDFNRLNVNVYNEIENLHVPASAKDFLTG